MPTKLDPLICARPVYGDALRAVDRRSGDRGLVVPRQRGRQRQVGREAADIGSTRTGNDGVGPRSKIGPRGIEARAIGYESTGG
jgi:hypothetical protein